MNTEQYILEPINYDYLLVPTFDVVETAETAETLDCMIDYKNQTNPKASAFIEDLLG